MAAIPDEAKRTTTEDIAKAKRDLEAMIREKNCGPIMIRLAWHDAGTYCKESGTGGANGSMRFESEAGHGANNGLHIARGLIEPIQEANPNITCADLWQLAAVVAVEVMGGPRVPFRFGRKQAMCPSRATPDGRLPDAHQGTNHLRSIFHRMGLNDRDIVALSGAHTVGRCHPDRSGFEGPWTEHPLEFNNEYFRDLVNRTWTLKTGYPDIQFTDESGELMMLPSDMALLQDDVFRPIVHEYANDQEAFFRDFVASFQKLQELGVDTTLLTPFEE